MTVGVGGGRLPAGLSVVVAAGLAVMLAAGPAAGAPGSVGLAGTDAGAEADVEEAIRAYVDASPEVRQAQAKVDAAWLQYRKLAEVAASPTLSVSTDLGWGTDDGPQGLLGASPDRAAAATLTWSPVPPLSLAGRLDWAEDGRGLPGLAGAPGEPTRQGQTRYDAAVEATWSLWPPSAATDRSLKAEQARLDLVGAERAVRVARLQAAIDGRLWYARVQVRAARLELARRERDAALRQLERALAQERAGFVGEEAVLQARATAQKAAAAVEQAAGALRAAEQALGRPAARIRPLAPDGDRIAYARLAAERALGFARQLLPPWPAQPPGEVDVVLEVPALPEALTQQVVEGSPEVALARSRRELARRQLEAIRSSWGTASLFGSVEVPLRRDDGSGASTSRWSVGLSARLNLLDGGARRAEEERARRALDDAERAVADAARAVANELETRWHGAAQAVLELYAARAALDHAAARQAVAEARAGRGAASPAELDEARLACDRAALDLVEAAATLWAELERLQARMDAGP